MLPTSIQISGWYNTQNMWILIISSFLAILSFIFNIFILKNDLIFILRNTLFTFVSTLLIIYIFITIYQNYININ